MHLIAPVGIIDFNQQRLFGEVRQSRGTLDNKTQEVSLAAREHRREIVNHSETLLSFQIERKKCVKGINSAMEPRSIDFLVLGP